MRGIKMKYILRFHFQVEQNLKGVKKQTWEKPPLHDVPMQTMACASVYGRVGRSSSGHLEA